MNNLQHVVSLLLFTQQPPCKAFLFQEFLGVPREGVSQVGLQGLAPFCCCGQQGSWWWTDSVSLWNFSLNIMEVGCHHALQEGCERPEVSHAASTAPCSRGTNPCLVSRCLYELGDCSFPLWNVHWGAGSLWELQRQWWPCCQFPLRSAWLRRLLMSQIWAEAWSSESFVDGPYKSCNMKWLMWLIWFPGVGGGMEPAEYRFYI